MHLRALCPVAAAALLHALGGCSGPASNAVDLGAPDLAAPDLAIAPSGIGDPCQGLNGQQGSCKADQICAAEGFNGLVGGYCGKSCDGNAPCPADARCVPVGLGPALGTHPLCLKACDTDGDCRPRDYRCDDQFRVCVPVPNGGLIPNHAGTRNGEACVAPLVTPAPGGPLGGGLGLDDPAISTSLATTWESDAHLAVDPPRGRVVVTFVAYTGAQYALGVSASGDDGATFQPPYLLTLPPGLFWSPTYGPPIAVDANGVFHAAYHGMYTPNEGAVFVVRSDDGGASFGPPVTVTTAGEGIINQPSIAVSPLDGTVYVAWTRFPSASSIAADLRLARSTDGGRTFSPAISFNDGPADHYRGTPSGAVGADGRLALSWIEASRPPAQPDPFIGVERFDSDGNPMGPNARATSPADRPYQPGTLALDGNQLYLAFTSGDAGGVIDVRVLASLDGGATFLPSVKVNDDPTCATHLHPRVAIGVGGIVHVAWYDDRFDPWANFVRAAAPPAGGGGPFAFGPNAFLDHASSPFTNIIQGPAWPGLNVGLVAVGDVLYAAWGDARSTGVSHIRFAHGRPDP